MIKHRFIVELNHQQGEYLAHHVFLLTATSKAEAMIVAEKSAQTWYGDGDNETTEDDDDHYFGCGEVCITLSQVEQISEKAYRELLNVFNDLSGHG